MAAYARNSIDDGDPNQHVYILSSYELLKLERILKQAEEREIFHSSDDESVWLSNFAEMFQLGMNPGDYEI